MRVRNPHFNGYQPRPAIDQCPHALTPEERQHIADALQAGQNVRSRIVRKLLRLCDERLEIIRYLERQRAGREAAE